MHCAVGAISGEVFADAHDRFLKLKPIYEALRPEVSPSLETVEYGCPNVCGPFGA